MDVGIVEFVEIAGVMFVGGAIKPRQGSRASLESGLLLGGVIRPFHVYNHHDHFAADARRV